MLLLLQTNKERCEVLFNGSFVVAGFAQCRSFAFTIFAGNNSELGLFFTEGKEIVEGGVHFPTAESIKA